ncbi:conserved hypothetical protein [delta proteobacterium NaphS2]|nr:conserved hypothetical protein [delta proteobacterium NaphS2]EFK06134.1 conserved hypothetical protein [delta proteobacterium NaphS2]EFK06748.1 conserved hypothetical protein [delta proteobacterium NaphS2]EFK07324.1 conserved hypothetical protein [delta proteobacterium NaphS2]EFK07444.1 conserved hypothetical protein [delta proteobacterium NaphS2]
MEQLSAMSASFPSLGFSHRFNPPKPMVTFLKPQQKKIKKRRKGQEGKKDFIK